MLQQLLPAVTDHANWQLQTLLWYTTQPLETALDGEPKSSRTFCKFLVTELVSVVIELFLFNIYVKKKPECLRELFLDQLSVQKEFSFCVPASGNGTEFLEAEPIATCIFLALV